MGKNNIFKGIVWDRRYDGTWEVTDQYTNKAYIISRCVDRKYTIGGVNGRMSKPEISKYIIAQR